MVLIVKTTKPTHSLIAFFFLNHEQYSLDTINHSRLLASWTLLQATTKNRQKTHWWTRGQTVQDTVQVDHWSNHEVGRVVGASGRVSLHRSANEWQTLDWWFYKDWCKRKMKPVKPDLWLVCMTVSARLDTAGSNYHDDWSAAHTRWFKPWDAAVKPGDCMFSFVFLTTCEQREHCRHHKHPTYSSKAQKRLILRIPQQVLQVVWGQQYILCANRGAKPQRQFGLSSAEQ